MGVVRVRRIIGVLLLLTIAILLGFNLKSLREMDVSLVSFEYKNGEWGENEN